MVVCCGNPRIGQDHKFPDGVLRNTRNFFDVGDIQKAQETVVMEALPKRSWYGIVDVLAGALGTCMWGRHRKRRQAAVVAVAAG
jgi:hypothetical protein